MPIAHSDLGTDVITTVFLPVACHFQWDSNNNARLTPMGMNYVCMSRFPSLSRQLLVPFWWIMLMRLNWLAANFAMFRDEDMGNCMCFGLQKLEVQVLSSLLPFWKQWIVSKFSIIGSKTINSEPRQWSERRLPKAWLQKRLYTQNLIEVIWFVFLFWK